MEQKKKRNYGKMTAEELSAAVNLVKSENSGVFGVKDIRSAFKDLGVPMYSEFATTLVQQGVLVQAGLTYQDGFSWSYCDDLEALIHMMGEMNPKRESKMVNAGEFYQRANTASILAYLIESKDLIKTDPSKCLALQSYKNLKANGWRGIISDAQREHYLRCYRGLYDGWDDETMLKRLALYFGGSLARFQLEMTGANHEWGEIIYK